jgi:hypothetical protein
MSAVPVNMSLTFDPIRTRTRGEGSVVKVRAANCGQGASAIAWRLVPIDAHTGALEWIIPPGGAWPVVAEVSPGETTMWHLEVRPSNKPAPGVYPYRPYVELPDAGGTVTTTGDFSIEVPPPAHLRVVRWIGQHLIPLGITLILAVGAVAAWWFLMGRWVIVPNLMAYEVALAQAEAGRAGLRYNIIPGFDPSVPDGVVYKQLPAPTTRTLRGETIQVHVARSMTVPVIAGLSKEVAENILRENEFAVIYSQENSLERYDSVLGTDPPEGTRVPHGTQVSILLAAVDFSQLASKDFREVRSILERRGLTIRAYYWDVGVIVDEPRGICRRALSRTDSPCVAVVFGGPQDGVVTVGVVAG